MMNYRFVVTGGPGAGKTTTLDALAACGLHYVAESARAIIRERLDAGLDPRPPLDRFGREMLARDIASYRETPVRNDPVFFDRSIGDSVGFLYQQGAISRDQAQTYMHQFRYNSVVFIMPPWEEIYATDTERDQSFAEAVAVFESLKSWYAQWHYEVTEVPRASTDERMDFMLKAARAALSNHLT